MQPVRSKGSPYDDRINQRPVSQQIHGIRASHTLSYQPPASMTASAGPITGMSPSDQAMLPFQARANEWHGFEMLEQNRLPQYPVERGNASHSRPAYQLPRKSKRLAAQAQDFRPASHSTAAQIALAGAVAVPDFVPDFTAPVDPSTTTTSLKGNKPKTKLSKKQKKKAAAQSNRILSDDLRTMTITPQTTTTSSSKRSRARKLPHPIPTTAYLAQANGIPTGLPHPQKLLVILDLNGVLIYRGRGRTSFTPRPNLQPFLAFLFANHHVMVWSSCKQQRVDEIRTRLFSLDQQIRLVAAWGRETLRLGEHARDDVQVYKQLQWVWEAVNDHNTLCDHGTFAITGCGPLGWDQTNTVLIEDDAVKGAAQPFNTLLVDEYLGPVKMVDDPTLVGLQDYLKEVACSSDVSQYMRLNPWTRI